MTSQCHLTIKNELPELRQLQSRLEDFFQGQQLCMQLAAEMMLISEELLANTISYGYCDDRQHTIEITMAIEDGKFSMTLIDDAQAFNPLLQQPPSMGRTNEQAAIGGLGIPLVLALSDQQEYCYHNGRNMFIFSKSLLVAEH